MTPLHDPHASHSDSKTVSQNDTTLHTDRCTDIREAHLLAELVGVRVTATEERALLDHLMGRNEDSHGRPVAGRNSGQHTGIWGDPVLAELVVQVPHEVAGRADGGLSATVLCSRSYVRQAAGETRLATVLVSDDM